MKTVPFAGIHKKIYRKKPLCFAQITVFFLIFQLCMSVLELSVSIMKDTKVKKAGLRKIKEGEMCGFVKDI